MTSTFERQQRNSPNSPTPACLHRRCWNE